MPRIVLVFIFLLSVSAFPAGAATGEKISVYVSILPQKFFVERIGADRVTVAVMVKPGASPETYEPTPRQMAALEKTHLYFRIAVPFESVWIGRIRAINPDLEIIACCGSLQVSEQAGHDHAGNNQDSHIWTSPRNAIIIAGVVKDALSDFDPQNRMMYQQNHDVLVQELINLDTALREMLASLPHRFLIVSHPSWEYFADEYNLRQIPLEQNGSEIRARQLANIIELARQNKIRAVFSQKQFNSGSAEVLAKEINGRVIQLDPLAENYITNLYQTGEKIREGANYQ
ncbi:MAG: zinc ABC transporter substrate-binding protein [Gammaproteobacteria bacterium]|nr:zinc ABC transporter substrate-binding protein [Gammaproteobacteria bacterium]